MNTTNYTAAILLVAIALLGSVHDAGAANRKHIKNLHPSDDSDIGLTTPELAIKYGYPAETHKVTTANGYILTLHRIPFGKNNDSMPPGGRPVVFLQHGAFSSSSDWVMNTVEKAFAYRMADQGYDVWMGNARGNTYSKEHTFLEIDSKQFWSFSWHQMGEFDLPANFDYVMNVTGQQNFHYVGHSMGTTMFFVCMSLHPEYNANIRLMTAFAPVSFLEHTISLPLVVTAPFANDIEWLANTFGFHEFLPSSAIMEFLGQTVCHEESLIQELCTNIIFLVFGFNSEQLNATMLPVILGHTPAGASVTTVVHFAQLVHSGKFRQFDHGLLGNLRIYHQRTPPEYDLSKITVPVAFYWGENDWLSVQVDVYQMANLLPNLVRIYRVPHDKYNHMDFMYAIDNIPLLYETTEAFMKLY